MKTRAALIAATLLLGLPGLAHAGQILSPPLWTGVNTAGACYVRNTGGSAVTVQVTLFSNNSMTVDLNTCNSAPLGAGKTCVVLVSDLPDDSFVACSAVAGTLAKLRGTVEVRAIEAGGLRVIIAEDLR